LSGTVAEIRRPQTDAGVLEVWLKTGSGTVLVRLAPPVFLRQNGLAVREGEGLAVRGYDGGPEGLFTATEVERDGKPVSLRSSRGKPLW
jgi:hypothetical protein